MWCLVVLLLPVVAASPLVKTPYGVVEGFDYTLRDGGVANVFLGIPYAKPPVGALRYEKPEKPTAWKDVKETKTFGAPCFQHANTKLLTGEGEFSEDCLTMNIMVPSKTSTDPKGYPVMVFIYGGGFEFGSSSFYPYQNISENFVSEEIVFVTFNYRLSAFGFFSTGDNVIPGNLGYWDQTLALQFIQDVISHFGGNPDSVTITGESAGGASVSALTYSPHSNTLFHKAIAFSGSQNSIIANYKATINSSLELAAVLNCTGPSSNIKACMKSKTAEEIRGAIAVLNFGREEFMCLLFIPVIDHDFFPADYDIMLKTAPKVPLITGTTDREGGFFSLYQVSVLFKSGLPRSEWPSYNSEKLAKYIAKEIIHDDYPKKQRMKLIKKMIQHYVYRGKTNKTSSAYLKRYGDLFTDLYFAVPAYLEAQSKVAHNIPVYLYREEYHNPVLTANFPVKGAYHGNEIPYLFGAFFYDRFQFDNQDLAMQKDLLSGFISFAKSGTPVVSGKKWKPITKHHPDRYMSFSPSSHMKNGYMKEAIDFWTKVACTTANQNMLRKTLLPTLEC